MMEYLAKFLPYMLQSTIMTLEIFVLTLAIALPLGLPIALGSNSRVKPLAWLCRFYVLIFRGTPLMLQLFFFYFFFPLVLHMKMSVFVTVILTFVLNYAAYLAESIHERGLRDKIHLKAGIFGAEAWSEQMRQDIQKSLGIKAYDIYGLTELSGPGVAYECSAQTGMHINEDHFIAEIIDPDTGEVLPEGTQGELVFTSITKQAFPLLRYRTRDICILRHEDCPCGRTHIKMCKPMGRSDDMLIVKGVNVFPSQIETVLLEQGYTSNYQIVVDRVNNSDTLDVLVEMTPEHFSDSLAEITQREKSLVAALKAMLGIFAQVHLVSPKSIARSEGKAIRVIDKRRI